MGRQSFIAVVVLLSSIVIAARVPRSADYGNRLDYTDDETPKYYDELYGKESPTQMESEEFARHLEKRKFAGNAYPSYRQPIATGPRRTVLTGPGKSPSADCETLPERMAHSNVACTNHTGCSVECDDDYSFPDGRSILFFVCSGGQWIAEGTDFNSVPECSPDEDEEEEEEEEEDKEEEEEEEESCEPYGPTPNSRVNCATKTSCELRCNKGYHLPGYKNQLYLTCQEGEWRAPDVEDGKVPLCEPDQPVCADKPTPPPGSNVLCNPDGICEASCKKGYKFPSGGSSVAVSCTVTGWTVQADEEDATKGCLQELLTCNGQPLTKLENATYLCSGESCTATCVSNHFFPSGKSSIEIVCRKNKWEIVRTSWEFIPDCVEEMRSNAKCNGSQYLVFPNLGAYKVNTTHVSWQAAQKTCIHEGAHLAVVDSKEELELMKELIAPHHLKNGWTYAHIGFSDVAKRGVWVTVLGTMLDSEKATHWAPRNPSRLNERCGAIDHKGRLHDIFCSSEQIFICEKI